jgi:hypothetical protein
MEASDVLAWLRLNHPEQYSAIRREFPESLVFDGASLDHEQMGVDVEWCSWLVDAIEQTDLVVWLDGEPFTTDVLDALMLLDLDADRWIARQAEADGWLVKSLDAFRS